MIYNRVKGMMAVHSLISGAAAVLVFCACVVLHFFVLSPESVPDLVRYSFYCAVILGAFGVDLLVSKVRGTDLLQLDWSAVSRFTFRQTLTIFGVVLLYLVASKDQSISRFVLFSFLPVLYLLLFLVNRLLPPVLVRLLFRSKRPVRTLLVGSGIHTTRALCWCRKKRQYGLEVVGLLTNDPQVDVPDVKVIGRLKDLEDCVKRHGINQIISLSLPNSLGRMAKMGEVCDRHGIRLLAINDLQERFERQVSFFQDSDLSFVSLRQEPLESPLNRILKRFIDIALALPVVAFVMPSVSLAVSVVHRIQSPGPLFFRQLRSGLNGQSFYIYKYRTMHVNHGYEAKQATRNDDRVFKLGRLLRKLSLDELPQFINVLKGEMSIVGPRPHMPEHDEMFAKVAATYHVRRLVKPGITGLAQVRGFRGEALSNDDVVKRIESDVYYLENWSVSMEWAIILKTTWQMIFPPRMAY